MVYLLGYFGIMIIFMIIAIVCAKGKAGWIWYSVGAGIQLLSLTGTQETADANGGNINVLWLVYVAILAVAAIIMCIRRERGNKNKNSQ